MTKSTNTLDTLLRWGILGTGNIAANFTAAIQRSPGGRVAACASRNKKRAKAFSVRFSLPGEPDIQVCSSYEELATHPEVDIIYVATPHAFHAAHTRLCLESGKHVLCEKPFTLNQMEAEPLVHLAQKKQLFLMEAVWTRFMPAVKRVQEIVRSDEWGHVRHMEAHFCMKRRFDPSHRLFDRTLGGGALLDLGIYPLTWVEMILGLPSDAAVQTTALIHKGTTGVDEQDTVHIAYPGPNGGEPYAAAIISTALRYDRPREVRILGNGNSLYVPNTLTNPQEIVFETQRGPNRIEKFPFPRRIPEEPADWPAPHGYEYQVVAVTAAINEGRTECPEMPLKTTLAILAWMDEIRKLGKVTYPGE